MRVTMRRPARESERDTFYGPEEGVPVVVADGWAVLRCDFETTARAASRLGFEVVEGLDPIPEEAPVDAATEAARDERARPSRRRR